MKNTFIFSGKQVNTPAQPHVAQGILHTIFRIERPISFPYLKKTGAKARSSRTYETMYLHFKVHF